MRLTPFITCLLASFRLSFVSCDRTDCIRAIIESGVSDLQKLEILKLHNEYRKRASEGNVPKQPKPLHKLPPLKWDDELASSADVESRSCKPGTYPYPFRSFGEAPAAGQNTKVYFFKGGEGKEGVTWRSVLDEWFGGHGRYKYGAPVQMHPLARAYGQIVWSETKSVGCGFTHYNVESDHSKIFICNYYPSGNVVGKHPYSTK